MLSNRKNRNKMNVKEQERQRIIDSFDVYDVPLYFRELTIQALNSTDWDWFNEMDGCSCAPNYWPTRFNPPCLVHDYLWRTGRGGIISDKIFLKHMKIYSMPKFQRVFRFVAVRVGWLLFYKWKHKFNKNIRILEKTTVNILKEWKN